MFCPHFSTSGGYNRKLEAAVCGRIEVFCIGDSRHLPGWTHSACRTVITALHGFRQSEAPFDLHRPEYFAADSQ